MTVDGGDINFLSLQKDLVLFLVSQKVPESFWFVSKCIIWVVVEGRPGD